VRDTPVSREARQAALTLWDYCEQRNWAGYDPFDALNSKLLERLGVSSARWPRLIATQLLKRCMVNIRPSLGIPPTQNPKGLALFVSSAVRLARVQLKTEAKVSELVGQLESLRSPGVSEWCWGYPFPWQTRTILFPRWQPNIICTTFAANALLDAYDLTGQSELLEKAASAADFVLKNFYYETDDLACFSYTALARGRVHNANLLGAALLCRVAGTAGRNDLLTPAFKAARYTVKQQYPDGSWDYGESDNPPQRWRDNFHTGFNLLGLDAICRYGETDEFKASLRSGFIYYRQNFFEADGAPKYFHNRAYPFDIHSAAQSIITLVELSRLDANNVSLAESVFRWTMQNLRAPEGFYYYQKRALFTNKVSYMRWTQAWMLLALSALLSGPSADIGGNKVKASSRQPMYTQ
jgi:hypothetical protein